MYTPRRTRSSLRPLAVVAAFALTLAACSDDSTEDLVEEGGGEPVAAAEGDVLTVGRYGDIHLFNPFTNNSGADDNIVLYNLYDSLFTISEDGTELVPSLAESYEVSEDGTTMTIPLKTDVTFHDGSTMTSADVVFSLESVLASSENSGDFLAITDVTAPDDATVELTLEYPDFDLPRALASVNASVVPEGFGEGGEEAFEQEPIGTGPFAFSSRTPGSSIELVAYEDHFAGAPELGGVTYTIFTDPNAASLAYEAGDVDLLVNVPSDAVEALEGETILVEPSSLVNMLQFNSLDPALADVEVRKALSMAIDREELVEGLLAGIGTPAFQYVPPAATPDAELDIPTEAYTYDPEAAAAIISDAGLEGTELDFMFSTDNPVATSVAQLLQSAWEEIGITTTLRPLDGSAWLDDLTADPPNFDVSFTTSSGSTASHFLALPLDTAWLGAGWPTDVTEELIREYRQAEGDEAQAAVLSEWETHVATDLYASPMWHSLIAYKIGPDVEGFTINPFQDAPLEGVTVAG